MEPGKIIIRNDDAKMMTAASGVLLEQAKEYEEAVQVLMEIESGDKDGKSQCLNRCLRLTQRLRWALELVESVYADIRNNTGMTPACGLKPGPPPPPPPPRDEK